MGRLVVLAFILSLITFVHPQGKPVWPQRFTARFNETENLIFSLQTNGTYWYDFANGKNRVDRENGKLDRYCGSVYKFVDTPCTHLVVDGKRYLIFPKKQYCCLCCDASKGCGILLPSWVNGAKFIGYTIYNGNNVTKWDQPGLQSNYYYQTVNGNLPAGIDQVGTSYMAYDVKSYTDAPIDPSVFDIPTSICEAKCPLVSICSLL